MTQSLGTLEQLVADLAAWEDANPHPAGLGPSDVGRCRRQLMYRESGTEPDPDYQEDRLAATLGTAIHSIVAEARRLTHPSWLVEESLPIPGLVRNGTVDCYGDGIVDDLKTVSARRLESTLTRGRPWDDDADQVLIYGLALEHAGHVVKKCTVTYLSREAPADDDRRGVVFELDYDHDRAVAALARLHAVQDALDDGVTLPRDGRGPGDFQCDRCPFLQRCWQLKDVPAGYSAQSWELAPEEVQAAAAELNLWRKAKAKAEEHIEALVPMMVGHHGQTFVDGEGVKRRISWTNGGKRKETGGPLDSKAVRARYEALGEEPPTLGTSPQCRLPAAGA